MWRSISIEGVKNSSSSKWNKKLNLVHFIKWTANQSPRESLLREYSTKVMDRWREVGFTQATLKKKTCERKKKQTRET